MNHHQVPRALPNPASPCSFALRAKLDQLSDLIADLWPLARDGAVLPLGELERLDALAARLDRIFRVAEDNYVTYHTQEQ